MKKNREAKKAKKELESGTSTVNGQVTSTGASIKMELTDDPEKNKKIKKVKSVSIHRYQASFGNNDNLINEQSRSASQKLDQISKLKEQLKAGKQLEINQLDKIKKEDELLRELEELAL